MNIVGADYVYIGDVDEVIVVAATQVDTAIDIFPILEIFWVMVGVNETRQHKNSSIILHYIFTGKDTPAPLYNTSIDSSIIGFQVLRLSQG